MMTTPSSAVPESEPTAVQRRFVADVLLSRRSVLQVSGVAALATGAGFLGERPAHAATPNSLYVGGPGSVKAFGRTTMPEVSGDFRVSFDYFFPEGTMSSFVVFSSFDTEYRGPQLLQTGDRLTVTTSQGSQQLDQPLKADQWHRFILEFDAAGTVAIFIDGIRQTAKGKTAFEIDPDATYTYYGYLGDLSSAGYNGTAFFDNIEVRADDEVTFSQTFDNGAAPDWTQISTGGAGVFALADPVKDAEVVALTSYEITAEPAMVGAATTIRIAGLGEGDRDVWVDGSSVELAVDSAYLELTAGPGGYFTVTGQKVGTTTVTATVPAEEGTQTLTAEVPVTTGTEPAELVLSAPISPMFVGDHMLLRRVVTALNGDRIDPSALTWQWQVEPSDIATVDDDAIVHATRAGEITVTATGTSGEHSVTADLELEVAALETVKTRSTFYTEERLTQAASNISELEWAATTRDSAVESAAPYLAKEPAELWALVTSQDIPRSYAFTSNEQQGCLNCGTDVHDFGQYPYTADVFGTPWKVTCPSCSYVFPTNDFGAYYAGGLDEYGYFDEDLAKAHNDALIADGKPGNLVNTGYPDKGEGWGTDNGAGTVLENGSRFTPIAYYTHWKVWHGGELSIAINALRDAYLYTGEAKYAAAGIVLLDRVADVYPGLDLDKWNYQDGYLNSNGNTNRGKVVGSIWETGLIRNWILAYDAFYPALATTELAPEVTEALQFLDGASQLMDKTNPQRVRRNIEDGVLREILPSVKRSEIRGNNGMHQATLALAGVVLDHLPETQEILDFTFASGTATGTEVTGGNLSTIFTDQVDRDGNGDEAAPGYNSLWLGSFTTTADYLDDYRLEGLPVYDLYSNPKYLKMFEGIFPLTMLGAYTPTIGDTGATGGPLLSMTNAHMIKAFAKTERPIFAQVLHAINGNSTTGLRLGIFDADPDGLAEQVQTVVDEHGPWREPTRMLTGYGFAALRDGEPPAPQENPGLELPFSSMQIIDQTKPTKYFDTNGAVQFEATTVGDSVTFGFNLTTAVSDTLTLNIWTANSYGVYEVALDGEVIAEEFSFVGSGATNRELGEVALGPGNHTVTFTLVTASPGAKCGVRTLSVGEPSGPVEHGTQRGATMYFGRNTGHGHRDTLNIDLFAHGLDLLPDLGYPRYANAVDMHRKSLVLNTISHNTVVVDDKQQDPIVVGTPIHFDTTGDVQVIEVDAPKAYGAVSRYHRTLVQVRVDDATSYLVDLFRVTGGSKHLYSFHAMQAEAVTTDGVTVTPQQNADGEYVGTYAGANVPYDDTVDDPTGFSYFYDVDRNSSGGSDFSATWEKLFDTWNVNQGGVDKPTDVNVRLSLLGDFADVALANCEPPQNKPGNPESLRYLFARSTPESGSSVFTGVIEAFQGAAAAVQEIAALPVTTADGESVATMDVRAVRVTLADGRVDTIVHALDPTAVYVVDDHRFCGRLGVLVSRPDSDDAVHLFDGTEFGPSVFGSLDAITGTVTDFTTELTADNTISVALDEGQTWPVDPKDLVGRYLFAEDDGERNAVYRLEGVESSTETAAEFSLGTVSAIRAFVDPKDPEKGYVHDLAKGRAWRIPLRVTDPTDAAAQLTTLSEQYADGLAAAGARQVPTLVDVAARHAKAGRSAEAITSLEQVSDLLGSDAVVDKVGAAGAGRLRQTTAGWLRQLG